MDIKQIRVKALLTQVEFAKEIGVTLSCVAKWEAGSMKPSLKHQRAIVKFCEDRKITC